MSRSFAFLAMALLTLTAPTPGEIWWCDEDAGCYTKRSDDNGGLEEEVFRKGDMIDTEQGWVVSPDDGWVNELQGTPPPQVGDGSVWIGGGRSVTVRVTDPSWGSPTDVSVRFVNGSGSSPSVPGSGGYSSTPTNPTCDASDPASTPDGTTFRVGTNGRTQFKNANGNWVNMRPMRKGTG